MIIKFKRKGSRLWVVKSFFEINMCGLIRHKWFRGNTNDNEITKSNISNDYHSQNLIYFFHYTKIRLKSVSRCFSNIAVILYSKTQTIIYLKSPDIVAKFLNLLVLSFEKDNFGKYLDGNSTFQRFLINLGDWEELLN